ncbi:MAG: SPFH domain-containing protein [Anaerolineae bacterium]
MTADPHRLEIAAEIVKHLREKRNAGSTLHEQALNHLADERYQEAAECCGTSFQLARQANDLYGQAAARFHLGLIYYVWNEDECDRAVDYCQEAAQLFHSAAEPHEEGVTELAIGELAASSCASGKERWQQGLQAFLKAAYIFDQEKDRLAERARARYREQAINYSQHGLSGQTNAQAATSTLQNAATGGTAATGAAPPQTNAPPTSLSNSPCTPTNADMHGKAPHPAGTLRAGVELARRAVESHASSISLRWIAMLYLGAVSLSLVILASSMLAQLIANPNWQMGFIITLIGSGTLTAICIILLKQTGYLFYSVPQDSAAIIIYQGRVWTIEKPGFHILLPFLEQLDAFIRRDEIAWHAFLRDLETKDGFRFVAFIEMRYKVDDISQVWARLRPGLVRPRLLGEERPANLEQSNQYLCAYIEERVYNIVTRALIRLASDPKQRPRLAHNTLLGEYVETQLALSAALSGIQFSQVSIRTYSPMQ